jgi:arylsulfatase A-like enzyme
VSLSISRRRFLQQAGLGAVALSGSSRMIHEAMAQSTDSSAPRKRPNIVFVFSDEHRWCSLPFTEMPELKAPNFTRMARQGVRFSHCISNNPICVPYRAILLSGMWPHQSTAVGNSYFGNPDIIGKDAPTIAHTFGAAGYRTGYVGKWHLKDHTTYQAGFDYFKHWKFGDDHWKTKWRDVSAGQTEWNVYEQYNVEGMNEQAYQFLTQAAKADDGKPFLLMLSWNPPHWRWDDAPEEYLKLYPEGKLSTRPNAPEGMSDNEYYRNYHAHITADDHYMGKLLDKIDDLGLADDTVVIYTSDHGSGFGSNGYSSKVHPYDESIRVPFIVRWPGKTPTDARIDEPVGAIDLYPTLCGLAGIEPPAHCGGKDFSHLILGQDGPGGGDQLLTVGCAVKPYFQRRAGKSRHGIRWPFRGIRTDRYTFVINDVGDWLLFDNREDPYQMNNLVDDPKHAKLKEELRGRLRKLLSVAEDPYVPEQWRKEDIAERVAFQNEQYVLKRYDWALTKTKDEALEPFMKRGPSEEQKRKLRALADEVYSREWFLTHLEILHLLYGFPPLPGPRWRRLKDKLDKRDEPTHARFRQRAEEIMQG